MQTKCFVHVWLVSETMKIYRTTFWWAVGLHQHVENIVKVNHILSHSPHQPNTLSQFPCRPIPLAAFTCNQAQPEMIFIWMTTPRPHPWSACISSLGLVVDLSEAKRSLMLSVFRSSRAGRAGVWPWLWNMPHQSSAIQAPLIKQTRQHPHSPRKSRPQCLWHGSSSGSLKTVY